MKKFGNLIHNSIAIPAKVAPWLLMPLCRADNCRSCVITRDKKPIFVYMEEKPGTGSRFRLMEAVKVTTRLLL